MSIEVMKQALEALEQVKPLYTKQHAIAALRQAIDKAEKQEPVTILPDGSAFGVMSFPLPSDHWLYAPNEYRDGEFEPIDLPKPILTHALRDAVVAAVRYAVRGATVRGQETDFDPDALVKNAVYALCGPYTTPQPKRKWVGTVDCIGLALDLEAQAKRVESQTVERAILAAANGLRIIEKESKA